MHLSEKITKSSLAHLKNCTSITISSNIDAIEDSIFSQCSSLRSISVDPDNSQFASIDGILFTKNLETLLCFPANHHLSNYTIPTSVKSIGNYAFSFCSHLQSITIPTNVTSIGDSPFNFCSSLQSINVDPNNLQYVSIDGILFTKNLETLLCFPANHHLSNYTIPTTLTSIGDFAFCKCVKLQSLTIPTSVTSIGDSAFSHCFNLQSITIPTSVKSIGDSAFKLCSSLRSISVDPNNLHYVSIDGILFTKNLETLLCFPAKRSLSKYTIPTSVTSIGNFAFSDCSLLQSITIPTNVTSIGDFVFAFSSSLQAINVDPNNSHYISIDGILFTKNIETLLCFPANHHLLSYTIPTSVKSIGNSDFFICTKLQSITILPSVTSICNFAFSFCNNLQSIPIPTSVTSIGNSAFSDCSNLQSITIPTSVTSIGDSAFSRCSNLCSILIPDCFKSQLLSIFPPIQLTEISFSLNDQGFNY